MKKVYISLPIHQKDEKEQRELAAKSARHLTAKGYEPINPFDIFDDLKELWRKSIIGYPSYREIMASDLEQLESCDYIMQCKGWEKSNGCMIEHYFSKQHGIKVLEIGELNETNIVNDLVLDYKDFRK